MRNIYRSLKSFDTVDHDILLYKLEHYGIRGIANSWICSHLKNRRQTVQVGPYISKTEVSSCGVPQGSVLGPLLLLLYINDISYSSNQLNFFLVADDTNLLYADKNLRSLEVTLNNELTSVCNWLMANIIPQHKEIPFCNFSALSETYELRPNHKAL